MKRLILILVIILSFTTSACGSWLIYHKPEFSGKVIDAETKEPLEGAVVVAVYNKTTMGLGAGTLSSIINVREALTNKEGSFRIPSYTTFIQPFSWAYAATFVVFKPGYASVSNLNLEEVLSKETVKDVELPWIENKDLKFKIAPKVIGLPKLNTWKERDMANRITISDIPKNKLPLLNSLLDEEENFLQQNKGWRR